MERLSLHELAAATGGRLVSADRGAAFTGVSIDSRTVRPGDAFCAIEGPRQDGHDFIDDAFDRGAAAAVIRHPHLPCRGPAVIVDDPAAALGRLAGWYRSLLDAFVIGVTGSVGKTTTRELIFAALGGAPDAARSPRNFNNQLGVPLTLLGIEKRHRFAVVEMGAARIGEIAALAATARPEAAVITRFGVAHVETFGSEQAIVRGKTELVESLPPGGFAVLPGDQPAARFAGGRASCDSIFVGEREGNHHRVRVTGLAPESLRFVLDGTAFEIKASAAHLAVPAAMAVTAARRLGRSDRQIAAGLAAFEPVAGRGRIAVRTPWTVVDDSYNANPDSMAAAVDGLAAWPARGRRVLVCGDMYGLGERALAAHVQLGAHAAAKQVNLIAAIGDFARQVAYGACREGMDARRLACFADRTSAAEWLRTTLRPGDVVWVKASRPLELEHLVADLAEAARATRPILRSAA